MSRIAAIAVVLSLLACCLAKPQMTIKPVELPGFTPSELALKRAHDMLANMTLMEKIGQMTQISISEILADNSVTEIVEEDIMPFITEYFVGSFLNSPCAGGPVGDTTTLNVTQWMTLMTNIQNYATTQGNKIPIIYGLDTVHGVNYMHGATLFPQEIGAAATFNRTGAYYMGAVGAKDTRTGGIPWVFSPILGISVQPMWPRVYETFGEDPFLASEMGASIVAGIQGGVPRQLNASTSCAACMKHFLGYSDPRSGQDRTPAWIPDRYVSMYFQPSFQAAVDAEVATAMSNSGEINGEPVHSSRQYLYDLLRETMGFDGMLVTDWQDIQKLYFYYHIAANNEDAVYIAINQTSIDMSMVPYDTSFSTALYTLVTAGWIPEARVDESAARVLALKAELGILDAPFPDFNNPLLETIGSDADRAHAQQMCRESITLLENNNNILPLDSSYTNVLVTGPTANSLTNQAGGWTIHWQGAIDDSEFWFGSTLFEGIKQYAPAGVTVTFMPGCSGVDNCTSEEVAAAVAAAKAADVVFVGIGEAPYAETPGDITDLTLFAPQQTLVTSLIATGTPVVVMLVEGRPRLLNGITANAAAVLHAYLPGPEGGQAMGEIVWGLVSPSGRLPYTYPQFPGEIGPYWHKVSQQPYSPQWEFGTGLSYTTFSYESLTVSPANLTMEGSIEVSVDVRNTGMVASMISVLMFVSDLVRIITPEVKMLKGFEKISLLPGEMQTVSFTLIANDTAFYGLQNEFTIEAGEFAVSIGNVNTTFWLV